MNSCITFADKHKQQIRENIIQCLRRCIDRLGDKSYTRKDHQYDKLTDEPISISNQSDWEQLGSLFASELSNMLMEPDVNIGNEKCENLLLGYGLTFMAAEMGQSRRLTAYDRLTLEGSNLLNLYSSLRMENVERISLDWAKEYCSKDPENYIALFNTAYILEQLGPTKSYYPQAGLGSAGNLQYNFPNCQNNISAAQFYLKWGNKIRADSQNFYVQLKIADSIASLSKQIYQRTVRGLSVKAEFKKRGDLLAHKASTIVEDLIEMLKCGVVKLRMEAVWTKRSAATPLPTLAAVMEESSEQAIKWMASHKLNWNNAFWYFEKKEFTDWVEGMMLPCSKKIRNQVDAFKGKKSEKSIFDFPEDAIITPEGYRDLFVAECVISYFFFGNKNIRQNANKKRRKISIGDIFQFQISANATPPETFSWEELAIDDKLKIKFTGSVEKIAVPFWMKDELLGFLKDLTANVETDETAYHAASNTTGLPSNTDEKRNAALTSNWNLIQAILAYFLANAALNRRLDLPKPFTLFWVARNETILGDRSSSTVYIVSTNEIIEVFRQNSLRAKKSKRTTDIGADIFNRLVDYRAKKQLPYIGSDELRTQLDKNIYQFLQPFVVPHQSALYIAVPYETPRELNITDGSSDSLKVWKLAYEFWRAANISSEEEVRLVEAMTDFYIVPVSERKNFGVRQSFESISQALN